MKLPRNLSANELINLLKKYNYEVTRQAGSHIRLSTKTNGQHHITIPNHSPLKVGTLASLLKDISNHLGISKEDLNNTLFD